MFLPRDYLVSLGANIPPSKPSTSSTPPPTTDEPMREPSPEPEPEEEESEVELDNEGVIGGCHGVNGGGMLATRHTFIKQTAVAPFHKR